MFGKENAADEAGGRETNGGRSQRDAIWGRAILSKKRRPRKPMRAVHPRVRLLQLNSHLPSVLEERSGEDPITQPRRRSPV